MVGRGPVPGGRRALDLAVCAGRAEVVRLLLAAGADPEERMRHHTALEWAARFGHPAVVEQLIARGAAVTERALAERPSTSSTR
ncbi:ankyrin repeat domain-containing protein, partial [Streptomyces sp. NPDC059233]